MLCIGTHTLYPYQCLINLILIASFVIRELLCQRHNQWMAGKGIINKTTKRWSKLPPVVLIFSLVRYFSSPHQSFIYNIYNIWLTKNCIVEQYILSNFRLHHHVISPIRQIGICSINIIVYIQLSLYSISRIPFSIWSKCNEHFECIHSTIHLSAINGCHT